MFHVKHPAWLSLVEPARPLGLGDPPDLLWSTPDFSTSLSTESQLPFGAVEPRR